MLQVEQLTTALATHRFCWSFALPAAGWMAIIGPSGVGKTMLLNTLVGLQPATAGRLSWYNQNLMPAALNERPFGILFQRNNLFDHLSVAQNLAFGLSPNGRLKPAQRDAMSAAASRFQLTTVLRQTAGSLSVGQQQRVAIARLFLQNKPVLLLDEPFSALDPSLRAEGIRWLADLKTAQQTTILMVTHHLDEILDRADTVLEGVAAADWRQTSPQQWLSKGFN